MYTQVFIIIFSLFSIEIWMLVFVGVRRGPSLSPSDSQRRFDPERSNGSLNMLTNNTTQHNQPFRLCVLFVCFCCVCVLSVVYTFTLQLLS